jgi:2Fe-2S ferredoxin
MRVANDHNVPGILADCGGSMSCATCHVYLSEEWTDRMDPPSDEEVSMLEMAVAPQSNSRLSCQIIVTSELHGLLVNIPEKQF